jgi:hypothetical protein
MKGPTLINVKDDGFAQPTSVAKLKPTTTQLVPAMNNSLSFVRIMS